MNRPVAAAPPDRHDQRIIIHFDYDCFYASVFEAENPALKQLPLAVQQKQIIVTCNYEARRRGLHKLQLITEAKTVCPDVIIVLGEDLTRFRNASKALYQFLQKYCWSKRVERLGFDEVFMDVSDMIDYNFNLLNHHDLEHSFFHLDRRDPTTGFNYDATQFVGSTYPPTTPILASSPPKSFNDDPTICERLLLGAHLAQYLRHVLEEQTSYTATVGISTNKLLAKLVGNVLKPKNQTTLLPPYTGAVSTPIKFIAAHDVGGIPGIGFRLAQKLRAHVRGAPALIDEGLIYGAPKDEIKVEEARSLPGMSSQLLERILSGPGAPHGIGDKVWKLFWGVDDSPVAYARKVPTQISFEDSYIRLDTLQEAQRELRVLTLSLIKRMYTDLLEDDDGDGKEQDKPTTDSSGTAEFAGLDQQRQPCKKKHWLCHPRTLRLSTRPRPPIGPDGTRARSFARISRSMPLPSFIFNLSMPIGELVEKLVVEALWPLFKKLHPEKSGWNLSLVNVAVTGMQDNSHEEGSGGRRRDIGVMFRRQDKVLRDWKVEDRDVPPDEMEVGGGGELVEEPMPSDQIETQTHMDVDEDFLETTNEFDGEDLRLASQRGDEEARVDDLWIGSDEDEDGEVSTMERCSVCGAILPLFAMSAHERYHALGDV